MVKKKPSSAKGTVKDCHILGHALRLSGLLPANYPFARIFISSNQSDFANSIATNFHPNIAPDAAAAQLRYASSREEAVANLRALGQI